MLASASYSQTSNDSTRQTDKATLISLCEKAKDEVVASRALIAAYEDTLAKQEKEQTLADAEILKLRDALDHEKAALAQEEQAVAVYKKALGTEKKKKNFYKRVAGGLLVTTVTLGAIVVLKK